jgi:GDSL-like Lipase/Acylhydrolase family
MVFYLLTKTKICKVSTDSQIFRNITATKLLTLLINPHPMKLFVIISLLALLALLILELILRSRYGLGDPLLYKADERMGYLIAPNQNVKRNGNDIRINRYSMRSDDITDRKVLGERRFFFIGDSVINGGWWTSQSEIISERFKQHLQAHLKNSSQSRPPISVLNASANSWSPRSELEYLRRYGTFEADTLIIVINTDDLFATAPTSLVVGRHSNYPDRKPLGAIGELVNRYRLSKLPPLPELQAVYNEGGDRVGKVLEALQAMHHLAVQNNAKCLLIMTPLLREVEGKPRDYELVARDRLLQFTQKESLPYIDLLELFKSIDNAKTLYQDHIHLNAAGNEAVSKILLNAVL